MGPDGLFPQYGQECHSVQVRSARKTESSTKRPQGVTQNVSTVRFQGLGHRKARDHRRAWRQPRRVRVPARVHRPRGRHRRLGARRQGEREVQLGFLEARLIVVPTEEAAVKDDGGFFAFFWVALAAGRDTRARGRSPAAASSLRRSADGPRTTPPPDPWAVCCDQGLYPLRVVSLRLMLVS